MKKRYKILIILYLSVILVNLLAWLSPFVNRLTGLPNLCDIYLDTLQPVIVSVFARISNLFPFSVGEFLLCLAGILILCTLIIAAAWLILRMKKHKVSGDAKGTTSFFGIYFTAIAYLIAAICWVMTLNCTLFYHASKMDGNPEAEDREYTIAELEILRNYIIEECNSRSLTVNRDEDGLLLYDGDLQTIAKDSLRALSVDYPRLAGYYPNVKHLFFSGLMCQSDMCGWYFPFSMEANVNGLMYISEYPGNYCHELAHLHGYIQEDEANYIAFRACTESPDPFFQYCGYLDVLYYVNNTYYDNVDLEYYNSQPSFTAQVAEDNSWLLPEVEEQVEQTAILPTETVNRVVETFTETSLELNGVSDGLAAYGRVVELLLQYYDGILY